MQLPARIGKYRLLEFLGGGMSHVYRAEDTVLSRTVAVKILTEAGCADQDTRERFLHEARMAGGITHDNIISVFDFGVEQNRPYIVMEFLRGESLRDAIKNNHTGDLVSRLTIAIQVARALDYIHQRKITHRDIKPENIHIDAAGKVKLMDFGIAKSEGLSLTKAGFTLGTPYYMAPEQVLGQQVTHLVDVYAFGILLFELFTGQRPVTGDSVERIFHHILYEPLDIEPLRKLKVPESVIDVVVRSTQKNAAQRIPSLGQVADELEQILNELTGAGPVKKKTGPTKMATLKTPTATPKAPTQKQPVVKVQTRPVPAANQGGLLNSLPPALRSQSALMVMVAVLVLAVMGILYGILSTLGVV